MTHTRDVLVVEDDPVLRGLICDVLVDLGLQVTEAVTADEGRALFADVSEQWSLVLTDITTPGRSNGCDLAWDVFEANPALPVLVCSGYMGIDQSSLPPHAHVMCKPWSLDAFEAKISQLLNDDDKHQNTNKPGL